MKKHKKRPAGQNDAQGAGGGGRAMAFSFGEPESVMQGELSQYLGVYLLDNGQYYQTPIPLTGLARLLRANAYHWPMLEFKVNKLLRGFTGSPALDRITMRKVATDYMVFANAYLQRLYNLFGQVVGYAHLAAINMRRAKEDDQYIMLGVDGSLTKFAPGEVLHVKTYDVAQEVYGLPSYLGAIQSMLLQRTPRCFGGAITATARIWAIFFTARPPILDVDDENALREAMKQSKGVGNFRNLFLHIPNGKEKDIQILPVGDFSTRDELEKIKNISRDDIIAAHRIPPALANIIPSVAGGLGDIEKADAVYVQNEIEPLREDLGVVNHELPEHLRVHFAPAALPTMP
jgi:Bacteriophage capsid portal protein